MNRANDTETRLRLNPALSLICLPLLAIAQCEPPDWDEDGYPADQDCDDHDASVYPGAPEVCDQKDNNCNGEVDEGPTWFPDADGDGFGAEPSITTVCEISGYARLRGDCDDADPLTYPGAVELDSDGIDSDCGGKDGPQPSVGLEGSVFVTLQEALDTSQPDDVVWVGPGTWFTNSLSFRPQPTTLISVGLAESTILDAKWLDRVVKIESGMENRIVVDGFTIQYRYSIKSGGGICIYQSDVVLRDCVISSNYVIWSYGSTGAGFGGGIYVEEGTLTLENCVVTGNSLDSSEIWSGAGLFSRKSEVLMVGGEISKNRSFFGDFSYGAGLAAEESIVTLLGTLVEGNYFDTWASSEDVFSGYGGGLSVIDSEVTLKSVDVINNGEDPWDQTGLPWGGGLYGKRSIISIESSLFRGNKAYNGGGVRTEGGTITVANSIFEENSEDALYVGDIHASHSIFRRNGHAFALRIMGDDECTIDHCLFNDNESHFGVISTYGARVKISESVITNNYIPELTQDWTGAGIVLKSGNETYPNHTDIVNSIVTYNIPYNVFIYDSDDPYTTYTVTYSDLYNPPGEPNHNLGTLDPSNLTVEPGFLTYNSDGFPTDFHLSLGSRLINKGDPAILDVDGTRSDMGAFGGPGGDGFDLDLDGYPNYFWPGTIADAPDGFDPADYDEDDEDPAVF